MNPCIGDRPLDPPEDNECETCGGSSVVIDRKPWVCPEDWEDIPCPDCMLRDADPGEPNDYPE